MFTKENFSIFSKNFLSLFLSLPSLFFSLSLSCSLSLSFFLSCSLSLSQSYANDLRFLKRSGSATENRFALSRNPKQTINKLKKEK